MLEIKVPGGEFWSDGLQQFFTVKDQILHLEHSLIAISKWESRYHKAFLGRQEKTTEEILFYIKCMTLNPNVDDKIYMNLTSENISQISAYIDDPQTATWFTEEENQISHETVTNELIYYWMIEFGIPVEFQKWHINRLLTLIRVCSIKKRPPKKIGSRETLSKYKELNAKRRAQYHSKG